MTGVLLEVDFSKPSDSRFEVTSNKEYDISTFDDLYLYYSSMASADYGYVNYKLYNNSEETAEEKERRYSRCLTVYWIC